MCRNKITHSRSEGITSLTFQQRQQLTTDGVVLDRVAAGLAPVSTFARVYVDRTIAVFALYGTAPMELTLALAHSLDADGVVAATAAHDVAAVGAERRLLALTTRRAHRT